MRVFLTGGSGFIGTRLAKALRERGDDVAVLVRQPAKAAVLEGIGCEVIQGLVTDNILIDRGTSGAEVVFHLAGRFEVGIKPDECPQMHDVNAGGVRRVLDSAIAAGCSKIVYVSTVNVFGNTRDKVVDESYKRSLADGFLSCYDESKYKGHVVAENRIAKGAPVVIVQPGLVYGPDDHFAIGGQILEAAQGTLSRVMFPDLGFTMSYVDDVVQGILAAGDSGTLGESYVVGGETVRLENLLEMSARLGGQKLTSARVSTKLLNAIAPFGPLVGPLFGQPSNLREVIKASDGVTYWATDAKARRELGYSPRPLEEGLVQTLRASGVHLA